MKNKELLLQVAANMVSLAESIKALAREEVEVEEPKVPEEEVEVKKPEAPKVEKKKEETKEQKAEPKVKKYTMEEVRKVLAEKSSVGFTAEVRALLEKHGGAKLSKIPETEYAAIMEEVKEIG